MGLFKSAEEKKTEERILVKRAIGNIKSYLGRLGEAKARYIEAAKRAKSQGIASQYKLARSGLSMVLTQQKVAEQLLLTMEMSRQMKDTAAITTDFASGMDTLTKEINDMNSKLNVGGVKKRMRSAFASSSRVGENLQDFMEESNAMFGDFSADNETDAAIDALIEREAVSDESALDAQMNEELESLLGKARK